jgi:hypothetical protein
MNRTWTWSRGYRIVIDGTKARLFVHGPAQPCLIVNDMKFGDSEGAVALFVGPARKATSPILKLRSDAPWFCFACEPAHGVLAIRGQIGSNPL